MKFIKYIAAALLLTAALTSCETGVEGTPGQTTVQFASAVVQDGFGAGYVYVPLTIVSDSEAGMNSCDVQAKVKVVVTGEEYEGTHDIDGNGGDYSVTSFDVNFPPYDKYFDKKEPEKYFDEESQKWVKEVYMEVKILNSEVDELRFSFEIESATTTIGEQKQCKVVLEKTTRDRLCGNYTYGEGGAATLSWNGSYQSFEMYGIWQYPIYLYWNDATEELSMYPWEPLMWYNPDAMQMCYSAFFTAYSETELALASSDVVLDYSIEDGYIKFPTDLAFGVVVIGCDENYTPNLEQFLGRFTEITVGLEFTKVQ